MSVTAVFFLPFILFCAIHTLLLRTIKKPNMVTYLIIKTIFFRTYVIAAWDKFLVFLFFFFTIQNKLEKQIKWVL